MSEVYFGSLAWALGEVTETVEQAVEGGRTLSAAPVLREAGFERHHRSPPRVSAYEMARRAVEAIRGELGDVGAIVYATCIPANGTVGNEAAFRETRDVKHLMDFPASHLQADFSLDRAVVVGLNQQACTGMLGSLELGALMLRGQEEIGRVLCVTADRFPEGALYEQAYNLISDGAAAGILSLGRGPFRLLAAHGITNGALARASDDETVGQYFTYVNRVIQETLGRAGLGLADVAWIVPQNTNVKAWKILSRLLQFDLDRVAFPSMPEAAHVISADNMINLETLLREGRIQPKERVLLVMSGYGLNWRCVILERT